MGSALDLNKVKIGHSPLTDTLYIFRHGTRDNTPLAKREAEADVISAVITKLMHNAPKGSSLKVTLGDTEYELSVKPVKK
jgi:hypothetical protein